MNASRALLRALPIAALAALPSLAFGAPPSLPFSGTFTTQEVLGIDPVNCPTTLLSGTTTGSGTATHLGATTGTGSDCIGLTSPTQFHFSNGKLTLFAANGDQLRMSYGGALNATLHVPVYAISGSFTITGGTGRFVNATGNGALSGFENLVTRQGQLVLNGVISY